ncbi:MAG TPA: flagellar basal body P-ring formation chaperone FlgA [Rhizomicrobium sp.]|nr:flagellar basal body P-ring formation chaperone FlgA [Rhizomicrobium sp.]
MTRSNLILIAAIVILPAMVLAASSAFAGTARVVVPAHDIARGDVISDSDLTYATVEGSALMSGVSTKLDDVKGMQARRVLSAGQPFRRDDVRRPIIVTKGQTVTMQFAVPGVELTAMGRAMSEGGVGDTVTVQNLASYRMISATVTAPGTVRASGGPISPPNILARR